MTATYDNVLAQVRIANFSDLEIPVENLLTPASQDVDTAVTQIRCYADLPYFYLVSDGQKEFVSSLLANLEAIRSPCYPCALFYTGDSQWSSPGDVERIDVSDLDQEAIFEKMRTYAVANLVFDHNRLRIENSADLPENVDVMIVGSGVTGLYAANFLREHNISFCIADKRDEVGGIWSQYANTTSQVNTSEGAYRLIEKEKRSNIDHSPTREILEDLVYLSHRVGECLYLNTEVNWIEKGENGYQTTINRNQQRHTIQSKGVILAVNDRVGPPRKITWENQEAFQGDIFDGISNETRGFNWKGKKVAVIGMGAFAVENVRTALVGGAEHVTVISRRHGTICPKIIDYLNFASPYDDNFKHDNKSNIRNMILWKKLYDLSGATTPECWMGKIKHTGHTISVSDIWFIGHYLKKMKTIRGRVSNLYDRGLVVDDGQQVEADVVINCVGFHRNADNIGKLCSYRHMYNNNYVDKDFMYLADAYLDDDVFNSFFGSSVLEMVKFYMNAYVHFFDSPEFEKMIRSEGITEIPIVERAWSHYIAGAESLMRNYPVMLEAARNQVTARTQNFKEVHDLPTYIAANRREWFDIHNLLAGKQLDESECLPYVFESLLE